MSGERCRIICADVLDGLRLLSDESVHCVVTSPPYFALRDYGVDGQIGLEKTPNLYVEKMVEVFREVRRVLRADGTLWLNIGDSYASDWPCNRRSTIGAVSLPNGKREARPARLGGDLKTKDLIGIPWMLAFALRADGWYLRCDVIWNKPNPMPESVTDRPSKAHEYLFLLAKSERYYYNHVAIRTPAAQSSIQRWNQNIEMQEGSHRANGGAKTNGTMKAVGGNDRVVCPSGHSRRHAGFNDRWDLMEKAEQVAGGANARSVWTIATQPYAAAHFATFPENLVKPCVLAGSPEDGTVLDPFMGSGTTGLVAMRYGRNFIGIELNPEYVELAKQRLAPVIAQQDLFTTAGAL